MKFKVDRDMCQSAAVCIAFLTKNDQPIYQLNDENKAEIITKSGDKLIDKWVETKDVNQQADSQLKDLEKVILDSAKSCPFNAIIVKNDKGKQIWPEE